MPVTVRSRYPSKMFPSKSLVVVVALFGACVVCAESPVPAAPQAPEAKSTSVGLTAILNCMWEDDAAECLRTQSARALQELSSSGNNNNGEVEEPTFLEVLREGSARVLELFSEDEHKEADPAENVADDEHARTAEEGRKKVKIPKLGGKKGKKGGGLLQTFYMLKMMFGMLVSMKIAAMSFLLQIKSFFLSLIFVGIAVIQFIWKLQEKKSHGGGTWQAYEAPQSHGHQAHGTDSYGGGWDKRSATATAAAAGILTDPIGSTLSGHDQAFRAHRPL